MVPLSKVQEVERLLAAGALSQRQIARQVGVSRATVSGVAAGSRPSYEARRLARESLVEEPRGPLIRCGQCGGRVYAPCRLCSVRQAKAEERAKLRAIGTAELAARCGLPIGAPPSLAPQPIAPQSIAPQSTAPPSGLPIQAPNILLAAQSRRAG